MDFTKISETFFTMSNKQTNDDVYTSERGNKADKWMHLKAKIITDNN